MKKILTIAVLLIALVSNGQQFRQEIAAIQSVKEAKLFIEKHPEAKISLVHMSTASDSALLLKPLYNRPAGYSFHFEQYNYRIIGKSSHPEFRVSYIYLDGSQLNMSEIDSLRKKILLRYKEGSPFYELVTEFTMDGNPSGDLYWFPENQMVKAFEMAVKEHKKSDIFTVDIPEKNWYYVVLKTFENREVNELDLLQWPAN